MILPQIPCEFCNELFTPGSPASKYCCDAHLKSAYRRRRILRDKGRLDERKLKFNSMFWRTLAQPTTDQLLHVCLDFLTTPNRQRIFVGIMPPDFKLPPGLDADKRPGGWYISQNEHWDHNLQQYVIPADNITIPNFPAPQQPQEETLEEELARRASTGENTRSFHPSLTSKPNQP